MVRTAITIESEIEDVRSIGDTSVIGKRKERLSSSSFGKKPKASSS